MALSPRFAPKTAFCSLQLVDPWKPPSLSCSDTPNMNLDSKLFCSCFQEVLSVSSINCHLFILYGNSENHWRSTRICHVSRIVLHWGSSLPSCWLISAFCCFVFFNSLFSNPQLFQVKRIWNRCLVSVQISQNFKKVAGMVLGFAFYACGTGFAWKLTGGIIAHELPQELWHRLWVVEHLLFQLGDIKPLQNGHFYSGNSYLLYIIWYHDFEFGWRWLKFKSDTFRLTVGHSTCFGHLSGPGTGGFLRFHQQGDRAGHQKVGLFWETDETSNIIKPILEIHHQLQTHVWIGLGQFSNRSVIPELGFRPREAS